MEVTSKKRNSGSIIVEKYENVNFVSVSDRFALH